MAEKTKKKVRKAAVPVKAKISVVEMKATPAPAKSATREPILTTRGLVKRYGRVTALDGSFNRPANSRVRNGATSDS